MYAEERQAHIEAVLASSGRVVVAEIARHLDVTSETVRRDLDQLETRGILRRVHGGAVAPSRASRVEASLIERRDRNTAAKDRIALAAMQLVPPSFTGSIAIDAGTTTGLLAQRLVRWTPDTPGRSLVVITHSTLVATTVSENPAIEVLLLGGRLRGITGAAVGATTLAQLATVRPDIAFIGTNGLHAEFGLSTPDTDEAAVKGALTTGARRAVALADASKLGEATLVRFATLTDIDTLITEATPDTELHTALDLADVEVLVA
ncbi:DeoR/GlpR family DNA-binding transcription regulator [Marisediminicola sp. LYQ134]|uniref:DeoR/GlpR family DNA-binding transcription regulator n=1 Tax=unclassified Marisediminicola TaxID=2618316 RepID=UPI00398340D9